MQAFAHFAEGHHIDRASSDGANHPLVEDFAARLLPIVIDLISNGIECVLKIYHIVTILMFVFLSPGFQPLLYTNESED